MRRRSSSAACCPCRRAVADDASCRRASRSIRNSSSFALRLPRPARRSRRRSSSASKPAARSRSRQLARRGVVSGLRGVLGVAGVDPQRAAVRRQLLDVEEPQPVRREDALDREEREVGEVLVVDRVELVLLHQPQQVRELHRDRRRSGRAASSCPRRSRSGPARGPARCCRASRSACRPSATQLARRLARRRTRPASGRPSPSATSATLAAGSMPSTGIAALDEVLQQVAVVARDLDDEALGPRPNRGTTRST